MALRTSGRLSDTQATPSSLRTNRVSWSAMWPNLNVGSFRGEPDGHGLRARDEVGRAVGGPAHQLDVGQPGEQLPEHHLQLQPGQRGPEAEVGAEAEGQVRVRLPGQVQR